MLRPVLAFATLCVAAFVLAPTVASVHSSVEGLRIHRELPWRLWMWDQTPEPPKLVRPDCGPKEFHLVSAVVGWPARIDKNTTFQVTGTVIARETDRGVPGIDVEVFLNATKERPGELLGRTVTSTTGAFAIRAQIPYTLSASRYHIVAHALEYTTGCKHYLDHYSDPEMDVTSNTSIVFDAPGRAVIGHNVSVTGTVVDSVKAPVRDATLSIKLDGQTSRVTTDSSGQFVVLWKATRAGNVTVNAGFTGSKFYTKSEANTTVEIIPEDVEIVGYDAGHTLGIERGANTTFNGTVFLAPGVPRGPLTLTFDGLGVAPCPTCPTRPTMTAQQDAKGGFEFSLLAPSPQSNATFTLTVTGGGLKAPHTFNGTLVVPVHVVLNATDTGLFSRGYHGNVTATDETGARLPGPIVLAVPAGWVTLPGDANGTAVFEGKGSCGTHTVQAYYNGTSPYRSATQENDVDLCGFLAFIPPWLLAMPWWGWALIGLATLVAWLAARMLYEKH
ncbi:MAG: carboxypeptidase-like regulatory domain-containing protein, partial [Candidatus Thermoplasmatota archaeon]